LLFQSDRIGVDEEVDDTKGMTEQEVKEMQAEREAKANAQLLEMVHFSPFTHNTFFSSSKLHIHTIKVEK
jgi:hypothetical protein